jgi:Glycosyltransferase
MASRWHDRMMLIPVTPDVQRWYGLADILVCASDVESLPRTVLEAMAWETPVLATSIFGLAELIEDGKSGWLCEAGDIQAMAVALDRFLETPQEIRQDVARAARDLVEQRHSLPKYANHISKLLHDVAGSASTEPQRRRAVSG